MTGEMHHKMRAKKTPETYPAGVDIHLFKFIQETIFASMYARSIPINQSPQNDNLVLPEFKTGSSRSVRIGLSVTGRSSW